MANGWRRGGAGVLTRRGAGDVQPPQWEEVTPYAHAPGGSGPVPVVVLGGGKFQSLADRQVTATRGIIRAASIVRISLVITNNDAAVNVRIGDENTDATHGVRVGPGLSMRVTARGDIYAITDGGATAIISMSEEIL